MADRTQDVTPYFTMDNCKEAHEWYVKYFNAKVVDTHTPQWDSNDKRYIHSSIQLPNGAVIFMSDRFEMNPEEKKTYLTKEQILTMPVTTHLEFKCLDAAQKFWDKATSEESGSKVSMKFEKQFWGSIYGKFYDTFGFDWSVATQSEEECASKNKKRSLTDSKSSDVKETHEEHTTPSKKKRTNGATNSEELHNGPIEIVECEERVGLFKEYRVGKNTGYDFGKAHHEGRKVLEKVKASCGDSVEWSTGVSICPEDPRKIAAVRFLPGIFANKNAKELKELVKDFSDEVTVVTIPAGKYLVYLHAEGCEGLEKAWAAAVGEFEKKGYKYINGESCYEEYVMTKENKLQTKIFLGIGE